MVASRAMSFFGCNILELDQMFDFLPNTKN